MDEHENNIRDRLIVAVRKYYDEVKKDFEKYKDNQTKNNLHCLTNKYPHLKRVKGGDSKILECKALVIEIIVRTDLGYEFTNDDKKKIYTYCVDKIQGIFKHAQAFKTGYCNLLIINGISEEKTISICITKNTLESNEQWLQRIFKEVNHRYPHVKTNKQIVVISSKKNDLDGNATHCKDLDAAWKLLRKADSQIKIIFICSNKTRLKDTLELLDRVTDLRESIQRNFRILHDEAHNSAEGIPSYRPLVENIVLHPNVLSYTPITATNHPIIDETNPLWRKENIEGKARNYTEFDNTKSSDPQYSSCSDAIQKTFETIPNWHDYGITKIPIKNFMRVHGKDYEKVNKYTPEELRKELRAEIGRYIDSRIDSDEIDICEIRKTSIEYTDKQCVDFIIKLNVERRRTLEFCKFMENNHELTAVNNGLNCLNMNRLLGIDYFQSHVFNIHVISTPNRNILTDYLCDCAIQTIPRAIVLGIYGNEGNKYHLFMGNDCQEVSHIMVSGEFNMKLEKLFTHLRSRNVDLNGPFIMIGNYKPTGESLTFVNSSYGTVRGNIRLISTNAEENYQEACRANYMTTKFVEKDPNWVMPEKFLVGPANFIEDVLSYERENDARIDFFATRGNVYESTINIPDNSQSVSDGNRIGIVAIPIKLEMDFTSEPVKEIVEILKTKRNRTKEDKARILSLLKKGMENYDIIVYDQTGKWKNDIDRFTLEFVRGFTNTSNEQNWRFESYQNCHEMKTGYINNTTAIKPNECELLACMDTYRNGSFVNPKLRWWIGYKYA